MRVSDFLEVDLCGVNGFHAAVFDGDDVVVKHLAAVSLKLGHDFVQPFFV